MNDKKYVLKRIASNLIDPTFSLSFKAISFVKNDRENKIPSETFLFKGYINSQTAPRECNL